MQNFKSYLKEQDINHNPQGYDLSLSLNCETGIRTPELVEDYENVNDINVTQDQIQDELVDLMPHRKIDAYFDHMSSLVISVDLHKAETNIVRSFIQDIEGEVYDNLKRVINSDIMKYHKDVKAIVNIREQLDPNVRIQNNIVDFYLYWAKPFNLSGIDKQIDCKIININRPEKITGNVLSLLKIKRLESVLCKDRPEWLAILNKHMASKDLLECQEEMITAGLKPYAKL